MKKRRMQRNKEFGLFTKPLTLLIQIQFPALIQRSESGGNSISDTGFYHCPGEKTRMKAPEP
jgi:hypothetical protein